MRISDWSSDVFSSDLDADDPCERNQAEHDGRSAEQDDLGDLQPLQSPTGIKAVADRAAAERGETDGMAQRERHERSERHLAVGQDRQRCVQGKSWAVSVVTGGRRVIKIKKNVH